MLDFEDVLKKAEVINAASVMAIEKYVPRRGTLRFYFDSRTTDEVHPFAYGNGHYYVCCPCCYQIERIPEVLINTKVECSNKKATLDQVYIIERQEFRVKRSGYTLDVTDWKG